MAEYIKRDSVTNLIKLMEYSNGVIECYADEFISDINAIPSADVAEVVRCKDCRFHTTDPECFDEFEITDKPMMCVGIRYGGVDPDWFCEHGARMDGE